MPPGYQDIYTRFSFDPSKSTTLKGDEITFGTIRRKDDQPHTIQLLTARKIRNKLNFYKSHERINFTTLLDGSWNLTLWSKDWNWNPDDAIKRNKIKLVGDLKRALMAEIQNGENAASEPTSSAQNSQQQGNAGTPKAESNQVGSDDEGSLQSAGSGASRITQEAMDEAEKAEIQAADEQEMWERTTITRWLHQVSEAEARDAQERRLKKMQKAKEAEEAAEKQEQESKKAQEAEESKKAQEAEEALRKRERSPEKELPNKKPKTTEGTPSDTPSLADLFDRYIEGWKKRLDFHKQ